jgi:tRNA (guanine-N7-)-methyltransferase
VISDLAHRPIRSFVLRQGRFSTAQRKAYDTLLPRFGIAYAPAPLNLERAFGRPNPKVLEIGFGMGETTAAIAAQRPEDDFLAIDVHAPGVGSCADRANLTNVRIVSHDAVDVVPHDRSGLPPQCTCSFPAIGRRQHPGAASCNRPRPCACRTARTRGYLHAATDWEEYALEMLATLNSEPFVNSTQRLRRARPTAAHCSSAAAFSRARCLGPYFRRR